MKYGTKLPGITELSRIHDLSKEAKHRLEWLDWYTSHGKNAELTCRHFGISKRTFYKWKNTYNKKNLKSLESRSRKPHRVRSETVNPELVQRIVALKKQYPRWGKKKIEVLLKQQCLGIVISESSIGRVLKRRGLVHIHGKVTKSRKRGKLQEEKIRALREDRDHSPGHMVQIDVKFLRVLTQWFYLFTAIDTKTRLRITRVYAKHTAVCGEQFLKVLNDQYENLYFHFSIEGYQTDNGSEFLEKFHAWIQENKKNHYFTYPNTPQMNGRVERVIRTNQEEFWDFQDDLLPNLKILNQLAKESDRIYNTIRPHQALGYLTPIQYYESLKQTEATVYHVLN